jgi:signal transduction histidine kinase/ligand-binding sensor domain-containing protein
LKRSISNCLISLLLTLVLTLGAHTPAEGQEGYLRFDRLSLNDGLSQDTVNAVLQDRLGFIWIGTSNGLNRYDGHTFTIYRHEPNDPSSLSDNSVLSLLEDSQGELWIGTHRGLDRFDPTSWSFKGIDQPGLQGVQSLAEDQDQRLWIGTQSQGLWVLDLDSGSLNQLRHDSSDPGSLSSDSVYDILVARQGELWIATDGGLDRFLPGSGSFDHYRSVRTNPNSPTSSRLRCLLEDRSGAIWIGTEGGGLNRLNPETGAFTFFLNASQDPESLGDNHVWDILEDQAGSLWLATPSGLDLFDPHSRRFSHFRHNPSDPYSLSGSRLLALLEDRSGAVWIGTQGAGLSLYRPAANRFRFYQPVSQPGASPESSLQSTLIQALLEDRQGSLWIGGGENILSRFDPASGAWIHFRHEPHDPHSLSSGGISSLAEDSRGRLWVATSGSGLNAFDPESGKFEHFRYIYDSPDTLSSNDLSDLLVSRSGALWVATVDAGISRMDPSTGHFEHFRHDPGEPSSLGSDWVSTLYEDQAGTIWVGTYQTGLSRFDPARGAFRHYRADPVNPNSLSNDQVLSLAEYPPGTMWIGTKAGLNRLDLNTETFTQYTTEAGLLSDTINCILPDGEGRLWVSTLNGLAGLDLESGIFHTYTTADGLQSAEFINGSCLNSRRGELFFGGVKGFNAFYPGQVTVPDPPPPAAITAVRKNNQLAIADYASGQAVHLSNLDETISIEFTALDFNATGGFLYRYKLEGFNHDWVEAGSRSFVSYTNLRPGNYTFYVRAANRSGLWSESETSLPIQVIPALWQNPWFWIATALLATILLYGGYRLRLGEVQRRNLALEQKVAELSQKMEAAAVAAERSRMARDLHDSVSQSLYSLVLLSEAGLRNLKAGTKGETDLDETLTTLARLSKIAQQALQEMRLMVYQLRQPALEKTGLAGALEHRLEAVERRASLKARLIVEGDLHLSQAVEQELYFLGQEALNNALKHAEACSVTVRLARASGSLVFEIQDDGRGFDPCRAAGGGFGLESMRQRAEKLGGNLEIESAPGCGTRIRYTSSVGEEAWHKKFAS